MPDILDQAELLESRQRLEALLHVQQNNYEPEQYNHDGEVICIDCDLPIQPKRLRAKPNAARCIDCQELWEFSHVR